MSKNKSTTCYICDAEATVIMNILNEEKTKTIEKIQLCDKCSAEIQGKETETKGKVTHAIAMHSEDLPEGADIPCEICITKKARTTLHVKDINTEETIKSKLCLLCSADLAIRTAIKMGGIDPTLLEFRYPPAEVCGIISDYSGGVNVRFRYPPAEVCGIISFRFNCWEGRFRYPPAEVCGIIT